MEFKVLIENLNKKFGTHFSISEQLSIEQIIKELVSNEDLKNMAKINTIEDFQYVFSRYFLNMVIDKVDYSTLFFKKILDDPNFKSALKDYLLEAVYEKLKKTSIES